MEPEPGPSTRTRASTSISGGGAKIENDPDPDVRRINEGVARIKTEGLKSASTPASPGTSKDEPPKFELSDKQKEDIKEAFDTLDYEGAGFIKTKDLKVFQYH